MENKTVWNDCDCSIDGRSSPSQIGEVSAISDQHVRFANLLMFRVRKR